MSTLLVVSKVRTYINSNGKRCSTSFLVWLDSQVRRCLDEQITAAGSRTTLTGKDADAYTLRKRISHDASIRREHRG